MKVRREPPTPVEPDVVITLSYEQALMLRAIGGSMTHSDCQHVIGRAIPSAQRVMKSADALWDFQCELRAALRNSGVDYW